MGEHIEANLSNFNPFGVINLMDFVVKWGLFFQHWEKSTISERIGHAIKSTFSCRLQQEIGAHVALLCITYNARKAVESPAVVPNRFYAMDRYIQVP